MKKILLILPFIFNIAYTKDNTEKAGDFFMYALPITAFGTTIVLKDTKGSKEFLKAFATTSVSTYILKRVVGERRPIGTSTTSFPSGHTSSAFTSAAFIHKRYGLKYAIIPYAIATFVAYSRVHAKKHFVHDVIAGAALGVASSWYFTTKYKNLTIAPYSDSKKVGIDISYRY